MPIHRPSLRQVLLDWKLNSFDGSDAPTITVYYGLIDQNQSDTGWDGSATVAPYRRVPISPGSKWVAAGKDTTIVPRQPMLLVVRSLQPQGSLPLFAPIVKPRWQRMLLNPRRSMQSL